MLWMYIKHQAALQLVKNSEEMSLITDCIQLFLKTILIVSLFHTDHILYIGYSSWELVEVETSSSMTVSGVSLTPRVYVFSDDTDVSVGEDYLKIIVREKWWKNQCHY